VTDAALRPSPDRSVLRDAPEGPSRAGLRPDGEAEDVPPVELLGLDFEGIG
jgi:hypothetical protein